MVQNSSLFWGVKDEMIEWLEIKPCKYLLIKMIQRIEREFFRKRLENFFAINPKIRQCEAAGHFAKEGIARQTDV